MIITTAKGARFDTDKPAKSNIATVLDDKGNKVFDTLRITGNMTTVNELMKPMSMVEVEGSWDTFEIMEDLLWQ